MTQETCLSENGDENDSPMSLDTLYVWERAT
jgi:hypothetical protein